MKRYFIAAVILLATGNCFAQLKQYNITAYGAVANTNTACTEAIQTAIDACNASGGGDVVVPTGVFLTGTIHLKSNVNLYLQSGAILRGSTNLNDYEVFRVDSTVQQVHKGMLFTQDAENVSITGQGQIDGNSDAFFELDKAKTLDNATTQYTRQGANFRHVESGIGDGPVVPKDRPYQMIVFSNCKRVTVKDVFITNAPFWCMHLADCDATVISGIRLWNGLLVPNADGIDITSCTNVIVTNCDIRSGDDSFAIVGYDHHFEIPGFEHLHHISENIIISNCNLQSSSSAIRIGFLDQNTVRNVQISNINITNSTRGIGIFLRDKGSLENISFNNIYIETRLHTGDWWGNGEPIHISAIRGKSDVKLGQIKHVTFSNIVCKGENGILLYGTAESVLQDISFNHIRFEFTDSKLNDVAGGNIDLRGCLNVKDGLFKSDIPGFLAQYVDGLSINDFQLQWTNPRMLWLTNGIEVNHFKNVKITNFQGTGAPNNPKAYPIEVKNGEQFVSDLKAGDVHKVDVK
jgi:polygalacturonase